MNKTLKFDQNLVQLIKDGSKKNTWRLFDDKNLSAGDTVDFLDTVTKKKFATAKLTEVTEKKFSDLDERDWSGHEKFQNENEFYDYYSDRYKQAITPDSKLKIVWFEILEWI